MYIKQEQSLIRNQAKIVALFILFLISICSYIVISNQVIASDVEVENSNVIVTSNEIK